MSRNGLSFLDVAIGRHGGRGLDTHRQELPTFAHKVKPFGNLSRKGDLARDELVGRCGHDAGFVVALGDVPGGPCRRRPRGELHRLDEDLLVGEHRELIAHQLFVVGKGGDVDVLRGENGSEAIVGELQQGTAHSEEVDELFGALFAARRPQSPSDATGQDDAIVVRSHSRNFVLCNKQWATFCLSSVFSPHGAIPPFL